MSLIPSRQRFALLWLLFVLTVALAACGGAGIAPAAEATAAPAAPAETASPDDTFKGLAVGFTEEGYPFRGSPDAPLTMFEFSDFQCPFCSRYFVQTEPAIDESFVRSGQLRVVFRDLPLVGLHPNAPAAHEAARCIAQQGAPLFWAMHDLLFRSQDEWSPLADPMPVFARLAEEIGANTTIYSGCMATREMKTPVEQSVEEATALGFDGTPSFQFVGDGEPYSLVGAQPFDRFEATITALLAGESPADARQSDPSDLPPWATDEGLALDPKRPGYTVAGDQSRGDADAPIVVVEFSDFQCPYCKRHNDQTQPTLDEKYVDTGQVRWVFKHFPLAIHPQAPAAGVAAECAADQGKFWEMYNTIFANVDAWSINDPSPVFADLAGELGLDVDAFSACVSAGDKMAEVQSDAADGTSFVRGTPTFVLFGSGQPRLIAGALPVDSFVAEIEKLIEALPAS